MHSLRALALFALSLTKPMLAEPAAQPTETSVSNVDHVGFQELLNALPAESIHAALHMHLDPQFKDGVYEYDRQAVEQIHDSDPPTATKLISAAIVELAKRQTANATEAGTESLASTTTEASPSTSATSVTVDVTTTDNGGSTVVSSEVSSVAVVASSSEAASSAPASSAPASSAPASSAAAATSAANSPASSAAASTAPAVIVPVTVETTDSAGSTTQVATSAIASASVSVTVAVTTTNQAGSTVTSSQVVAATVGQTTNAQGATVQTTQAASVYTPPPAPSTDTQGRADVTTTDAAGATVILSSVTSGQVVTATDARGSTFVTTYTPAGAEVSSLVLQTVTGADGQQSTITSFAIASAAQTPSGEAGASASASSTKKPGLQNKADRPRGLGKETIALVAGAVGVAVLV